MWCLRMEIKRCSIPLFIAQVDFFFENKIQGVCENLKRFFNLRNAKNFEKLTNLMVKFFHRLQIFIPISKHRL